MSNPFPQLDILSLVFGVYFPIIDLISFNNCWLKQGYLVKVGRFILLRQLGVALINYFKGLLQSSVFS